MELGKGRGINAWNYELAMSQWSPAFGAGKACPWCQIGRLFRHVAMEPSFWSWEKTEERFLAIFDEQMSQWSPAFGAGKSRRLALLTGIGRGRNGAQLLELGKAKYLNTPATRAFQSQWSPAFGAGKSSLLQRTHLLTHTVAMEPSFWSWEKGFTLAEVLHDRGVAMEPSFWSWEKPRGKDPQGHTGGQSQWSPAFGAGKSKTCVEHSLEQAEVAMEPSFWSWEKNSPRTTRRKPAMTSQWSPAFGAGKRSRNNDGCQK